MGMVVPFLSAALILREWRRLGWQWGSVRDSVWGVVLFVGLGVLLYFREQSLLIITINKGWLVQVPPLPLVAIVYAVAMVLAFGGMRLLRAAWFPVALMGAVIPVPQIFSRWVDLPLQHASASVARAFAHGLGQQLTEDKLRLMFTPEFGMFIAPGCNGIRGAVTLGLAAVVVGYVYRFRWFIYGPVVVGAVLLGYLFNFVRLCLLVVYYKLALPYLWMQTRAKTADYIIGGCLFLCAMFLFIWVANRLRQHPEDVNPELPVEKPRGFAPMVPVLATVAVMLVVSAVGAADTLRDHRERLRQDALKPKVVSFPQTIGEFTLVRTWTETLLDGTVVYAWGEYAAPHDGKPGAGADIAFGISPTLGLHDTTTCHMTRGEDPAWVGQIDAVTVAGPTSLSASLFNNGRALKLEAATVCEDGACRQFTEASEHVTMVYRSARSGNGQQARPVPVLIKAELADTSVPPAVAAERLSVDVKRFLSGVDLAAVTAPYSAQ